MNHINGMFCESVFGGSATKQLRREIRLWAEASPHRISVVIYPSVRPSVRSSEEEPCLGSMYLLHTNFSAHMVIHEIRWDSRKITVMPSSPAAQNKYGIYVIL